MIKNGFLLLTALVAVFYLGACGGTGSREAKLPPAGAYFDVAGFVRAQETLLSQGNPVVTKTISENQANAETKKISNLDWAEELETFRELDINKPAFRNAYASTRQQNPVTGNTTVTYRKKPGYDGVVQYLVIQTSASGQVVSMRGLHQSQNVLLSSRREMELRCHTKNGTTRVTSYSIRGLQKPLIFPALRYTILARLG